MKAEHVGPALLYTAAFYLAWLQWGTRSNPPGPVPYEDFKTGLTFGDVRELLEHEQNQARRLGQYMFVSRSTVLGRWREMKQRQYERYLEAWEDLNEGLPY